MLRAHVCIYVTAGLLALKAAWAVNGEPPPPLNLLSFTDCYELQILRPHSRTSKFGGG